MKPIKFCPFTSNFTVILEITHVLFILWLFFTPDFRHVWANGILPLCFALKCRAGIVSTSVASYTNLSSFSSHSSSRLQRQSCQKLSAHFKVAASIAREQLSYWCEWAQVHLRQLSRFTSSYLMHFSVCFSKAKPQWHKELPPSLPLTRATESLPFFKVTDLLHFNDSSFRFVQVVWKTLECDSFSDYSFIFTGSSCQ